MKRAMEVAMPEEKLREQLRQLKPERFAKADGKLAGLMLQALKALFDASRKADVQGVGSGIDELCTEGFDNEQLWAMLRLENEPMLEDLDDRVDALRKVKGLRLADLPQAPSSPSSSEGDEDEDEDEDEEQSASEGEEKSASEGEGEEKSSSDDDDDDGEEEEDEEEEEEEAKAGEGEDEDEDEDDATDVRKLQREAMERDGDVRNSEEDLPTELDEGFFKFSDMEKFVESVEQDDIDMKLMLEEQKRSKANKSAGASKKKRKGDDDEDEYSDDGEEEEDDDDDDEALLAEGSEDEFEDDDPEEKGAMYEYKDLWGAGGDAEAEGDAGDGEDEEPKTLSTHEKRQQEIRAQIEELEQEAMAEKPWELKGETQAFARPKNSLLEKGDLDVDYLSRPAPTITEESTKTLEDVIRQRILDSDFDDVERRLPMALDADYKPRAELSVEKSKVGLAEEYAKDYEQRVLGHTPEEETKRSEEQQEVHKMFMDLCGKLDALSNFHYTPKPPSADGGVTKLDVGAIQMEESMPVAESAAGRAAPEEIMAAKKGRDGVGKSRVEMDQTERRAVRQSTKAAKRARKRRREAETRLVSKLKPGLGNKHAKEAVLSGSTPLDAPINWNKSSEFFKRVQNAETGGADAPRAAKRVATGDRQSSRALRL